MKAVDELGRRLSLVESSKVFVLKEVGGEGSASALSVSLVPNDDGIYWVGGTTKLANGRELPSVFRVDTNAAGNLLSIYWKIGSDWYEHDSEEVFSRLGIQTNEVFPFDWSYNVPLEKDAFHL